MSVPKIVDVIRLGSFLKADDGYIMKFAVED